jgi:integrase
MGFWMAAAPFKHPETGVFYFRRKVPARIVRAVGKSWIKKSLGTKDPREARVLFVREAARVEELFRNAETLVTLSFQQVTALAAEWYAQRLRAEEQEPGNADDLSTVLSDLSLDPSYAQKVATVGEHVSAILEARGLVVAEDSRAALVEAFYESNRRLIWFLGKRAKGDYSEDHRIAVAPKFQRYAKEARASFEDILTGWTTETKPRQRTASEFRRAIDRLTEFVGTGDAAKITPENIADFKAELLKSGRSAKSVRNHLSAIGAVCGWAVRNRKLPSNPVSGITVKLKRRSSDGRRPFTLDEAKVILRAAKSETGAKHWVPLLLAYSGARIGEVAQLTRDDVRQVEGVWCLDINENDDKSLKNQGSARLVPLHPAVIEAGFVKQLEEIKAGSPLFPEFRKRDKGTRGDNATVKLSRWIRNSVGLDDPKLAPNHSWRHSFKDWCREANIRNELQDEITGHRPGTVARAYGSRQYPVKVLYEAIKKLPTIRL